MSIKEDSFKRLLDDQMGACLRNGVNDEFQAGYLCALYWTWKQAGYPETGTTLAADAMVFCGIGAAKGGNTA